MIDSLGNWPHHTLFEIRLLQQTLLIWKGIKINDKEACLTLDYPAAALIFNSSKNRVVVIGQKMFGENSKKDDNAANAFRHTLWNALMAQELGYDMAKKFADAHEYGQSGPSTEMDLYNNEFGRNIGKKYYGMSGNSLGKAVLVHFGSYYALQKAIKHYGAKTGIEALLIDEVMIALNKKQLKILRK